MRAHRTLVVAIGVFVVVLISMQLFLLMVGLEALLTYDRGLAWTGAATSVGLAAVSALLYQYLRRPGITARRVDTRRPREPEPGRQAHGSREDRRDAAGSTTG